MEEIEAGQEPEEGKQLPARRYLTAKELMARALEGEPEAGECASRPSGTRLAKLLAARDAVAEKNSVDLRGITDAVRTMTESQALFGSTQTILEAARRAAAPPVDLDLLRNKLLGMNLDLRTSLAEGIAGSIDAQTAPWLEFGRSASEILSQGLVGQMSDITPLIAGIESPMAAAYAEVDSVAQSFLQSYREATDEVARLLVGRAFSRSSILDSVADVAHVGISHWLDLPTFRPHREQEERRPARSPQADPRALRQAALRTLHRWIEAGVVTLEDVSDLLGVRIPSPRLKTGPKPGLSQYAIDQCFLYMQMQAQDKTLTQRRFAEDIAHVSYSQFKRWWSAFKQMFGISSELCA